MVKTKISANVQVNTKFISLVFPYFYRKYKTLPKLKQIH